MISETSLQNIYWNVTGDLKYMYVSQGRRSRLQVCPIDSAQAAHTGSNSTGFVQYFGRLLKIVCFRRFSSLIGSPLYSLHPITVQEERTLSPKKASRANLVAK